jgi:monoamine oxidase
MAKSLAPLLRHGARRNLPTRAGFARGGAPSRRDVLRVGAAGVAAALLGPIGCASHSRGRKPTATARTHSTVIIVGAGFAGLACADTLAHAGVNVVLLEATGRAGGRVRTDRNFIPNDAVELGGEWIGTNHPTWLAYAQEFGLRLEEPGAAPEPEGVAPPTTEPTESPSTAPGQPVAGTSTPRPVPFETEMDLEPAPADGQPAPPPTTQAVAPAPGELDEPRRFERERALQALRDRQAATQTAPAEADEPIILNGKLIRGEEADKLYEEVDAVLAKLIELARGVDPVRPWTSPGAAELDARSFAQFIADQQGVSDAARALLLSGAESDNGVPAGRMSLLAYCAMVAGGGFNDYYELSETYRLAEGNDALATALAQKLGPRIHFNSMVEAIRRTPDGVIVRTRGDEFYRGDAVVIATPPSVWNQFAVEPPLSEALRPQMGENVKMLLALREPVWEKEGLTAELTSDGLVGLTWAATESDRGPVALTLFSGADRAETLRRYAPPERRLFALAAVEPAYPGLLDALIKERFVDWPGFPMTRASYSFPAPGEVTAFGPVLVDGVVEEGLPPLLFAGEHTSYGFIGYMEGALQSGVRAAQILLGAPTPVRAEAPAGTQPAETQPAETRPAETQPVTEPVLEGTPA